MEEDKKTSKKINNVQSLFQSGGITTGEMNVNISHQKPERKLDDDIKNEIKLFAIEAKSKNKNLVIRLYGNQRESYNLKAQVMSFLDSQNIKIDSFEQISQIGSPHPQGFCLNKVPDQDKYIIEIGEQ
jgi:hypothetical protein